MTRMLMALLLCLAAWLGLRRVVGAGVPRAPLAAVALDVFPVLAGFAALLAATARPILSALPIVAAVAGLGLADHVKRAVLREPLVFADRAELLEIVRHPRLYLPFAGTGTVVSGAAGAVIGVAVLAWAEPPLWSPGLLGGMALAALALLFCWGGFVLPTWPPLLRRLGRVYARWPVTRDPAADAAALGMLACFIVHATLARIERPGRRDAAWRLPRGRLPADCAGPIVLVQAESFLDARRLHPDLAEALPHYAALQRGAVRRGRLGVPCWGANTVRSEFSILTGLPSEALGLDRFNPYEAFAATPLPSLVQQAREAGYRTICVHPFDLGFYGRSQVLPNLGFDQLVGPEGFTTAERRGAYVADVEVAKVAAGLIRQHGPRVLVLAITMENHGPWDGAINPVSPMPLPSFLAGMEEARELGRWLQHLHGTDAMFPILTDALRSCPDAGWLMVYGDHQPSLPGAFGALGLQDPSTDYLIWRPGAASGPREDISAHELWPALIDAMRDAKPAIGKLAPMPARQ